MKTLKIFCIIALTGLTCAALADAPDPAANFKQAAVEMQTGRWAEAERLLDAVITDMPALADAYALRGMSRYHLEKYGDAAEDLLFAIQNNTRHAPRTLYYLGLSQSKLGEKEKAEAAFRTLILSYPDSPEAAKLGKPIRETLGERVRIHKPRRHRIFLSLEGGYDSNPSLLSDGDGDMFLGTYLFAGYGVELLRINGSVFYQKYADQSEFDFLGLSATAESNIRAGKSNRFRPRLGYSMYMLDNEAFQNLVAGELAHIKTWTPAWQTTLAARFGVKSFVKDEDKDLDGNSLAFRFNTVWADRSWEWLRSVRLTAGWADEAADAEYWAYRSITGELGTEWNITKLSVFDISFNYSKRDYGAVDPYREDNLTRSDDSFGTRAEIRRIITRSLSAQLFGSYTRRNSNVDRYSSNQAVCGLGIMYIP